jgi:hypothetical protein
MLNDRGVDGNDDKPPEMDADTTALTTPRLAPMMVITAPPDVGMDPNTVVTAPASQYQQQQWQQPSSTSLRIHSKQTKQTKQTCLLSATHLGTELRKQKPSGSPMTGLLGVTDGMVVDWTQGNPDDKALQPHPGVVNNGCNGSGSVTPDKSISDGGTAMRT